MSEWRTYAVCTGCERKHYAPFADVFFIHSEVCGSCGEPKRKWPIKTMRYVSDARLLRPSTWSIGHWETRP